MRITNDWCVIDLVGKEDCLWAYWIGDMRAKVTFAPPVFEIDGQKLRPVLREIHGVGAPSKIDEHSSEHRFSGTLDGVEGMSLELVFKMSSVSPVVRFCYILRNSGPLRKMTKHDGKGSLSYLGFSLSEYPEAKEIQFSNFNGPVHSYTLVENEVLPLDFSAGRSLMGPLLTASNSGYSIAAGYEHGSPVPNAFIEFGLSGDRSVELRAVKGNYFGGQPISAENPYETLWLQFAGVQGNIETLAREYRTFVLKHQAANKESRRPYVFYNTWAFQERNKWLNDRTYLDSMIQERMLAEIDVAHRMGVDVFVIDTGWYEKTGDWKVSRSRFPDGLKAIREKLQKYGMKLGLWFSPTEAAVSSSMLDLHRDCIMSWQGTASQPHQVWETEESQHMCLVSRYADAFADELVRLSKELGVTYFKWDAVGQYGCDDPGHGHGNSDNAMQERAECYAFMQPRAMAAVVERLTKACPDAIVDFDVTEGGRCFGLAFLSAGKYFLINNGPYYPSYDVPYDWQTAKTWSNIFVHPGQARGWICRTPLSFDKWIPSVLLLTHYLPDDPEESQLANIASLILGQNGIWGDLLNVSEAGVRRFGRLLSLYKHIRYDIAESYPIRSGTVGGSPEIYEKILERSGRGALVAFATIAGDYKYVTRTVVASKFWSSEGASVQIDKEGRAIIDLHFEQPGAKIVFFGVDGCERRL